jgi:hypothetical protein
MYVNLWSRVTVIVYEQRAMEFRLANRPIHPGADYVRLQISRMPSKGKES